MSAAKVIYIAMPKRDDARPGSNARPKVDVQAAAAQTKTAPV